MEPVFRASAKVLIVDPSDRVLLLSGRDPSRPEREPIWFAVGGGIEAGETASAAARREVQEETGQIVDHFGPVVLSRRFRWRLGDTLYDQEESYFFVRLPHFELSDQGWSDLERRAIVAHRWWSLDELRSTTDTVFPVGLAQLLDNLLAPSGDNEDEAPQGATAQQ